MVTAPNTKRVCLILGQFPVDAGFMRGLSAYARTRGPWHLEIRPDATWFGSMPNARLDGMIVVGRNDVEEIARSVPFPVVNVLHIPAPADIPTVALDERDVGRMAGEYLVKCGYRRFAYYGVNGVWSHERFAGFQSALAEKETQIVMNTVDGGSRWPWWIEACDPGYTQEFVARLTPPTAVFTCDDAMARHVADACLARGLHVPSQVAILGVDNDVAFCESSELTLSSVDPDLERVGYEAAAMLKQLIVGEKLKHPEVVVRPRGVVARRSTDPAAFEDAEVAAAVRFIRASACDGIDVAAVCRTVSISRRELERRFREATGHSPGEEITRVRMEHARELLATTNLSMTEICARCGYEHPPSFSSAFHREVGMTPRGYRNKYTEA